MLAASQRLDTTTLFSRFHVDPATGVQTGHQIQARVTLGEVALHEGDHPPSRDPVVSWLSRAALILLRHSHRSTVVFRM